MASVMPYDSQSYREVCAVVVTYNPGARTIENLRALTSQVQAIVVDNTPGRSCADAEVLHAIEQMDSVRLIRNRQNLGIAVALNQGIREVLKSGYQWVATFDQDSKITPRFFDDLLKAYHNYPASERVALVAPLMYYPESKEIEVTNADQLPESSLVRTAMTSGSLIRTEVFTKHGFYDEALFIDYVDYEHCLRVQRAGYQLLRANRVLLHHRLGTVKTYQLFGRELSVKTHNAWRHYYITRNRLLIYRHYGFTFPRWCLYDFGWFFLELGKVIAFEPAKAATIRNILKGIVHGLIGKTGPLVHPSA
jgi:rhamnosyltransferase